MSMPAFIKRVTLTNYKSIAECSVELQPLTFLVGPNGSGKSNFLDALHFVSDALNNSLEYAIRTRKSLYNIIHYGQSKAAEPKSFSIELEFYLPNGTRANYALLVNTTRGFSYNVAFEGCHVYNVDGVSIDAYFHMANGSLTSTSEPIMPATSPDRLHLVVASGLAAFRPVYDALSSMAFYNIVPNTFRQDQPASGGERLTQNGSNIASVLWRIEQQSLTTKERIEAYLAAIVPSVVALNVAHDKGGVAELIFMQKNSGKNGTFPFGASSMSDGTLRALGLLVALFQTGPNENKPLSIVGIEEPETALHPAAVGALLDAMDEASGSRQILVTSHSADLLDDKRIIAEMLLAVVSEEGVTKIGPIDEASRSVLRDSLFTAGELLRMNQLTPRTNEDATPEADETPLSEESAV